MAALSGDLTEVERRLLALRNQAGQMQYALDMPARAVSPPRQDAWAAARSPGPPTGGLDPSAPDFLNRLADLKEQHARNLRELEMQLRAGAGVLSRSPAAAVRPAAVRPRSAGAARALASSLLDEAGRVERAAELDELIASVRARRGVDTSRLDAARQRFHHRPRSAPHRRPPTPRATVPQPFAFERRDEARRRAAMRERTTRQRRHSEGEAAHYRPFKAQPVPVSTVEPRYEYMVTQAEQRRTQIATECRQNLETAVKPFSFLERPPIPRRRAPVKTTEEVALEHKFKAKVVPPFVSMRVYEQMQHDDAVRKERVNRAAQAKLAAASLPPRMEMHLQLGKVGKVAAKELSGSEAHVEHFKPHINPMSPAIPAFGQMQARFEHALAQRKRSVPPTTPRPFSMYTDRRPNRMERVLRDIERDALVLPEQRWPHASTRAPTKYEPINVGPPPDSAYRTTLAAELRRASLEDEQELRRAIESEKKKENDQRLARQKRIGAEVAAVLKPTFTNSQAEDERRRRQFIDDQREKQENWERVKNHIETNVSKRPYLFEQASTAAHVDRARQERLEQFEKTLRENGLGDLIDD